MPTSSSWRYQPRKKRQKKFILMTYHNPHLAMEFLRSFLRRHFARKLVVASWNVGCFLKLRAGYRYPDIFRATDWSCTGKFASANQKHYPDQYGIFSFIRRHFAGKPVVASWNVGCFLRLHIRRTGLRARNSFVSKKKKDYTNNLGTWYTPKLPFWSHGKKATNS